MTHSIEQINHQGDYSVNNSQETCFGINPNNGAAFHDKTADQYKNAVETSK